MECYVNGGKQLQLENCTIQCYKMIISGQTEDSYSNAVGGRGANVFLISTSGRDLEDFGYLN